jgi:hypothetical protein
MMRGGLRFLGVTEDAGRFLTGVLATVAGQLPETDEQWDELPAGWSLSSALLAALYRDWATRCINALILGPP